MTVASVFAVIALFGLVCGWVADMVAHIYHVITSR